LIFVTVGSDFRGFDRLIKKMDEISLRLPCEILIQRGYSEYRPKNTTYFDFIAMDAFIEYIRRAELVVSHAGIGTLILCKKQGAPILILPRRKKYGEHMNDHQLEIARALAKRERELIYVAAEESQLEEKILSALKEGKREVPVENRGRANLVRTIRKFMEGIPLPADEGKAG